MKIRYECCTECGTMTRTDGLCESCLDRAGPCRYCGDMEGFTGFSPDGEEVLTCGPCRDMIGLLCRVAGTQLHPTL